MSQLSTSSAIPYFVARLPWKFLGLIIALGLFGLIVLYSAAGGNLTPWALPQGIRFFAFLGMAVTVSYVSSDQLKAIAFPAYIVVILMLIAVELLGFVGGGSQRWLNLGVINLQPSELMKPVIILTIARFYDMLPAGEIRGWNAIWPAGILIGLPAVLVLIQPDLGTATTIIGGGVTIMFLAGLPLRLFIGAGVILAAAFPIAYSMMHEYQRNRVRVFLDPESDPLGTGYHIIQSKIAIGSGGIFGKGYLQGTQSHLDYLPEGHTDFVFATMSEEWGLLGSIFVIVAYMLIINWGIRVAINARQKFNRFTAAGISTTVFFYFAINLMMVMGMAPVVGIPLPLISYGGSAMLTVMLCFGLLMAISSNEKGRY